MLEILEGYRQADAGNVRVLGLDPQRDAARLKSRVGLMLQQGGVYPAITAGEALALFASFYAHPASPEALLEQVGLMAVRRTRFRRLSGGQQRRLALAIALIGQPELVFLDEPTAGMDPQARQLTWSIVRGLKERGATVVLTTHLMDEAQRLADHVAIIDHGALLAIGTPQQLLAVRNDVPTALHLTLSAPVDQAALAALSGVTLVRLDGPASYHIEAEDPAAVAATVTAWLRDNNHVLHELRIGSSSLEDVFLQLTGTDVRE
jgi:ABC-2 type transport system ATP-binding protein